MDSEQEDKTIKQFFEFIGGGLILLGIEVALTTESHIRTPVLTGVLGLIFFWCGLAWNYLKQKLGVRVTARIGLVASDFRWWLGIIALAWLYSVTMHVITEIQRNNEIISLRNDVQSIANVINRQVLPRRLMKWQISSVASYLSQYPAHEVTFIVVSKDNEAKIYSEDLQQALTRGGWKVIRGKDEEHDFEGLSIDLRRPEQNPQVKEDPRNPSADQLLTVAFGLSSIPVPGRGVTTDRSVTTDTLFLRIGKRPRRIVDPDD